MQAGHIITTNANWTCDEADTRLFESLAEFLTLDKEIYDRHEFDDDMEIDENDENIFVWYNR